MTAVDRRTFLARYALPGLGLAALASGLCACGGREPLRLSIHPWIGYETLYLARDFGWLPPAVELVEDADASESQTALRAGRSDAATLTVDEVLRAREAGIPLCIVLVFNVSTGADVFLARAEIPSLADLRGMRIGLEKSGLGALLLQRVLQQSGLRVSEVELLDLPPARQLAAWRAGEVDAVISYEPSASQLRREGARPLFDTRDYPEKVFDVLAVRRDALPGRESLVAELLHAHFRGLEHLRNNRQDALYRIAHRQGISLDEAQRALAGVTLPSLEGNRDYLSLGSVFQRAAQDLNGLMLQEGLLRRADGLEQLYTAEFLPMEESLPMDGSLPAALGLQP